MWTCNFITNMQQNHMGENGWVFLALGWTHLCFTRVCCTSSHTYCNVWSSIPASLTVVSQNITSVWLFILICGCSLCVCVSLTKKIISSLCCISCQHLYIHANPHTLTHTSLNRHCGNMSLSWNFSIVAWQAWLHPETRHCLPEELWLVRANKVQ